MSENKLLETVADVAYIAGENGYFTGDSRADVSEFIRWVKLFDKEHKNTDWKQKDYLMLIEEFVEGQLETISQEVYLS